jgi:hypothetical protein
MSAGSYSTALYVYVPHFYNASGGVLQMVGVQSMVGGTDSSSKRVQGGESSVCVGVK